MNTLFAGMGIAVMYGVAGASVLYLVDGRPAVQPFLVAYAISFKCLISLGLAVGTALVVFRSQQVIPECIEAAFTTEQLSETDYPLYSGRYSSTRRSVTFAAMFVVVAFVVFSYAHFPLQPHGEALLVAAACAEYALGVYVGRKLFYAAMMLHSLLGVAIKRNLFKRRELNAINSSVNVASTLTVICVYLHVRSYYEGPFLLDSILGASIRPALLLPAIIATPVLLVFNFYPRAVLRRLYSASIDLEVEALQTLLQSEHLSAFEKRSHLAEVDRMSRAELRYSLQLTLSDLPIGITILVMVLEPLLSK